MDGAQERVYWAPICVRIVDVHVSCSSHCDTQLAGQASIIVQTTSEALRGMDTRIYIRVISVDDLRWIYCIDG